MKVLVIIGVFVLASCRSTIKKGTLSKPPNSRDTTITLKNSLGSILVAIPNRYDTFLVWTHFSDCSSCGYEKYRFQSSKLPIGLESGWIWEDPRDSIDQLTIEHSQHIRISDSLPPTAIISLHERLLDETRSDPYMYQDKNHFDTIQEINGKKFSIITADFYNDSTKMYSKAVWATTFIKGNSIKFKFSLLTKRDDSICNNFLRDSKQLLCQIKSNGL
ncbi:MAG: hypothetical protein WAT14_14185 [Chitinophagaceae bacterium]